MSVATTGATSRAPEGFVHQAVLYDGLETLLPAVLPFIRDGVARGEPVLVAMLPERLTALEAALGGNATRVDFVDMGELGANPACIIPEWRRFLGDAGDQGPVRGVAEPVWSGRRDVEIDEATLHEALLNVAFDDGPPWQLLCAYDVSGLPAAVVENAMRNHPVANGADTEARYAGHERAFTLFTDPLAPPPRHAEVFDFGPRDLAGLRGVVAGLARQAGVRRPAADDIVLAAHELATNSVMHGGGSGRLSAWTEPGGFVVEIKDRGVIDDPLVGRDLLQGLAENGRGVWMANQLCDLVQVRSGEAGTVVRLFSWLPVPR